MLAAYTTPSGWGFAALLVRGEKKKANESITFSEKTPDLLQRNFGTQSIETKYQTEIKC